MSTTVAEPPAATAVTPPPAGRVSPVEYVQGLSPGEKEDVFFALLAEARAQGERAGSLDLYHGKRLVGTFLTLDAWHRLRELPPQSAEGRALSEQAEADLGNTFDINEFQAECRREEASAPSPFGLR